MDAVRQGEIAYKLVKYRLREDGVHLSPESGRELGNVAKTIGVPLDELKEFMRPLIQEIVDECLK